MRRRQIASAGIILFLALLSLNAQPAAPQDSEPVSVFLINQNKWLKRGERAIPTFDSKYTKAMRALLYVCGDGIAVNKRKEGSTYVVVYRKRGWIGREKPQWGPRRRWSVWLLGSKGEQVSAFGGRTANKAFRKLCQQTDNLTWGKDEKTEPEG